MSASRKLIQANELAQIGISLVNGANKVFKATFIKLWGAKPIAMANTLAISVGGMHNKSNAIQ